MQEVRSKVGGWPLAVAIAVVLSFLFFIREILLPFVLAAAIAFILTPVVDRLSERLRVRRWIVGVLIYLIVLVIFGGLLYFVGGPILRDVSGIIRQFPQLLHKLLIEGAKVFSKLTGQSLDADELTKQIMSIIEGLLSGGAALSLAGYGVAGLFGGILMLVLLIYFLISGRRVAAGVFWLIPPEYRSGVGRIVAKILPMLWRYFVGLLAVICYTTTVGWIGFAVVFHVPHSATLSIAVGLLELVPVVGPASSFALIGLTAIEQSSLLEILSLGGFAIALRLSIDQIVGPLVLGRAAQVHPVVIIFAFLSGAALFGIIGLLLAVPVAASIKVVLTIYYSEPVQDQRPSPGGSSSVLLRGR